MQTSLRLGRISGIEIGLNWSWLLAAALIVWVLAAGVFPDSNPELSESAYLPMALVATVVFFASILAHELGHAVQAQREGMEMEGITLWVFGGVAKFTGQFPSAGAELRIALAGPAVSLVLGVGFLATSILVALPAAVDGVVHWLGYINLVLLGFNLLPALPLDGGRVLRALLWARKRDFAAATATAAGLGRFFGQALIVWGLIVVFFGGAIGGVWIAFIGWFLLMAAESEAGAAGARAALDGLRVRDLMASHPVTVPPRLPLERFMDEVFLANRHTAYPVADDPHSPLGLVSFREVAGQRRDSWEGQTVADRMVPLDQALVLDPDDPLPEAFPRLLEAETRRALVCERGELVGLLSVTDAVRVLEARGGGRQVATGRSRAAAGADRDAAAAGGSWR